MARLALLVPCHNASAFVLPFAAMVRAQERAYDEVLFFDDGSTDETARLVEAEGFTVHRGEENRGAAHARNRLLAATSAEYVHFHDIDDTLHPEFVSTLLPSVAADAAACCAMRREWPDGKVERVDRLLDLPAAGAARVAYFQSTFLSFNAAIYPRRALVTLGGFNENLRNCEDLHLLLRLAASPLRFVYHDRILTTWQLRSTSTHHAAGPRGVMLATLDCMADLCERWDDTLRRALAPTLLDIAWALHRGHDRGQAVRAARLAEICGARVIGNRGRRIRWLSRLVGPTGFYRMSPSA